MSKQLVKVGGTFKALCATELKKLNVINGPNGSGKSSLLEAIRFGVTGQTPAGKTCDAGFRYGDSKTSVRLDFEDGFRLEREITESKAHGEKHKMICAISKGPGLAKRMSGNKASSIIDLELGSFAPMWDLAEFTSLSTDKAKAFVLDLCSKAAPSVVSTQMAEDIKMAVESDEVTGLLLDDVYHEVIEVLGSAPLNWSEAMAEVAEHFKQLRLAVKRSIDDTHAATRKLTNILNEKTPTDSVANLDHKLRDTDLQILTIQKDLSKASGATNAANALRSQIRTAEQSIESAKRAREAIDVTGVDLDSVRRFKVLAQEFSEATESLDAAIHDAGMAASVKASFEAQLESAKERWQRIEKSPWMLARDYIEQLDEVIPNSCREAFEPLAELIGNECNGLDPVKAREGLEQAETNYNRSVEILENANTIQANRRAVARQAREAVDHARIAQEWHRVNNIIRTSEEQLESLTKSLKETMDGIPQVPVDELHTQLAALRDHATKLAASLEAARSFTHVEKDLRNKEAEVTSLETKLALWKAVEKACKSVREKKMHDLLEPLIQPVSKFIQHAFTDRDVYFSLEDLYGNSTFDMGWMINLDGPDAVCRYIHRSYSTMSHGERAIFGTALLYGLLQCCDSLPFKVMLLESAEHLDEVHLAILMKGCEGVSESVDNIVIETNRQLPDYIGDAWNVIHTQQPALAASA